MHILPAKAAAMIVATTIAIVLLFSFKTPAPPIQPIVADVSPSPSPSPSPSASDATPTPTPTPTSGFKDGQWTGPAVRTEFGNVQVRVIVAGGKITDVQALQLTNDSRRSVAISNYAAPQLHDEVLQAQSAQVNSISGATYTSGAYLQSTQAALDQAHV